ncbi:sensor histidine kinase [Alloscardovia macacae]|uniref:sensor histidine kinase n=1 Tax=Alloscardovia macacae TaxID=1160091 RepID=UPI0026A73E7A|nr:HAMP domain-containing sensor histidine kinase [Alloscardovia macacae]
MNSSSPDTTPAETTPADTSEITKHTEHTEHTEYAENAQHTDVPRSESSASAESSAPSTPSASPSVYREKIPPEQRIKNRSSHLFTREHFQHYHFNRYRPLGIISSLKIELSVLIGLATFFAFVAAWGLLKIGLSGWVALPITIALALALTYFFAQGLTAPLREIRDAAEALTQGDYTKRVSMALDSNDEVGQLSRSFNVMADELEHADQMRRDLIANVSHELRTPVSALQALVENMADGVVDPTPANLESIVGQTQRLGDLIAFLLDLSRMEAGAASLEISKFNVHEFLDDVIAPLEIADASHNHTIALNAPADIWMEGDEDRLRQLFTNIIANALKHSADNTSISVDAREDTTHGTVIINVVNFGSQIAPEDRSDIFRRYVKGHRNRPGTVSGGTGLGLSIARWAAELHQGTVQVVDDSRGVNFETVLPKWHVSA